MREFYETVPCTNFEFFIKEVQRLLKDRNKRWVFRGHKEACWDLRTTLERECERFGISGNEVFRREYNMVREFRRRIHHYEAIIPDRDNVDEWMGLMQHYGAPTRLLDFTYSPYVAAYFAFENAESGNVAVWAIDGEGISKKFKSEPKFHYLLDAYESYGNYRDHAAFRSLFLSKPDNRYILVVNPFRLNDRLAYQQGVFLCPASVHVGFMDNLRTLVNPSQGDALVKKFIIKVGNNGEHRNDALMSLHLMNINRITLFPGLVGFAESFKVGLMTVHGAHIVMKDGSEMPSEELWQKFSESTTG